MQKSTNYGLNLPDLADQFNLNHWNENTEKLDLELKKETDSRINNDNQLQSNINNSVSTLRSEISTAETNAKNLANATGVLAVAKGGTGATTQGSINKNIAKIIPLLENDPTDETLFTMREADDSLSDNASFFTRKAVSVWNYIKNKISSVLGLTATEYSGTSTFAKAPLNARVSISTVDTTKPYGLLAKYSTNITGYENIGFTFLAVLDLASTDINILNNVYLMRIAARRSKSLLDCLSFNCLYSSTGENPTLTLTYNFTANGTFEMELYGHFTSNYRTWKIIPVINSNGDYGILPLSAQKWIYQNISDTGANYCVSSPTVNLTNVVDITNPTSPVMFGNAKTATNANNAYNAYNAYRGMVHTCSTANNTVAKTVTVTGFTLTTGACIRVLFANGNNIASPTLNVNSTGAKEIVVLNTGSVKTLTSPHGSPNTGAYKWDNNTILELYYNGSYWVAINNPIIAQKTTCTDGTTADKPAYSCKLDGYKEIYGSCFVGDIGVQMVEIEKTFSLPMTMGSSAYNASIALRQDNLKFLGDLGSDVGLSYYGNTTSLTINIQKREDNYNEINDAVLTWIIKGY